MLKRSLSYAKIIKSQRFENITQNNFEYVHICKKISIFNNNVAIKIYGAVSGNATCILSKRKEVGSESSLVICVTFGETTQFDSNQQIFLFF